MENETVAVPEALAKQIEKRGVKFLESLSKKSQLDEFKMTYNVRKASGLKCPFCSSLEQKAAGSLWYNEDDYNHLVCRKCLTEYNVSTKPLSLEQIITTLRKIKKGEVEL